MPQAHSYDRFQEPTYEPLPNYQDIEISLLFEDVQTGAITFDALVQFGGDIRGEYFTEAISVSFGDGETLWLGHGTRMEVLMRRAVEADVDKHQDWVRDEFAKRWEGRS